MAGTIRSTFIRLNPQSKQLLILIPLATLCWGQAETNHPKWTTAERFAPVRLEALRAARSSFAKSRQPVMPVGIYSDFRTIVVTDSKAIKGLAEAAKKYGMDAVLEWGEDGLEITGHQSGHAADSTTDYPDERLNAAQEHIPEILARWDKELEKRKLTGFAAFHQPGNPLHLQSVLRGTVTHILAREATETALNQSLKEGRAYVAHDWLADPTGFAFVASNHLGVFQIGDTIPLFMDAKFTALLPLSAKIKLIHNGKTVSEATGSKLEYSTFQPGYYRLEAWLEVAGEPRPWIYSNPIYVTASSSLKLPSNQISEKVEARRDVEYTAGKPEDAAKHKLDIYAPKGKTNLPVFVFIHGGAWKQGDRSQYPALGSRLAQEGIAVVIPSYRLAPANQHPAQIDDVRAAFRWTMAHLKEFGGDPSRVYVGGHSAGGQLASLLALTEPGIRGVAALSGVYDVTGIANVFTTDPDVRKAASPLSYVRAGAPPFTITYCQWDYLALPQQAKQFAAALKEAGVNVNLVYVPGESHISEIISAIKDLDPTFVALTNLIK